jgi:hypothetical protein
MLSCLLRQQKLAVAVSCKKTLSHSLSRSLEEGRGPHIIKIELMTIILLNIIFAFLQHVS